MNWVNPTAQFNVNYNSIIMELEMSPYATVEVQIVTIIDLCVETNRLLRHFEHSSHVKQKQYKDLVALKTVANYTKSRLQSFNNNELEGETDHNWFAARTN